MIIFHLLASLTGSLVLGVLLVLLLPYPREDRKRIWSGYLSYMLLFGSFMVLMFTRQFRYVSVVVAVVALYEVIQVAIKQQKTGDKTFLLAFPPLAFMVYCFLWYADKLLPPFQLYTCATAFVFNLFSWMINQLPNRHRLFHRLGDLSLEGLLTGLILSGLIAWTGHEATAGFSLVCWPGIVLCSVMGSLYTHYCKGLLGISVYGRLIPGTGGIFDVMGGFFGATMPVYLAAYFFPL